MSINMIVACDANLGIGYKGTIPWHCKEDLQYFKKMTHGNVVVMGHKTYKSLEKPLAGRINVVVTSNQDLLANGDNMNLVYTILFRDSIDAALESAKSFNRDIWIIGGASIYHQALERDVVDNVYITQLSKCYETDAYINPLWHYTQDWIEESAEYLVDLDPPQRRLVMKRDRKKSQKRG